MINETIIFLTYYYEPELRNHRLLKYVKDNLGAYLRFDLYLYEPLQKIFSKVILYDYLKRRAEIGIKAMNEEIIALVRKEHAKYVLWTSFYDDVQQSTLDTIREEGSTVVGWFFDDEWRFDSYSKYWSPYLDYCVTNSIEAVPKYRALNARVIQTIPNTGIAVTRDWSNIEEKYDVSFVGSMSFTDRKHHINKLREREIPIHLFGEGSGGYVPFEQMIDIFMTSKINLNFSKAGPRHWVKQMKGRVFQVCMAGGFLLTEYAPGIENYFEIDREIVCFNDTDEMIDKVIYYLEHDEERRAVARAGWEKATSEYTSSRMVAKVFREIERDMAAKDAKSDHHPPQRLEMPVWVCMIQSQHHFRWARSLLEENDKQSLWKDSLALSLSHNPSNISAHYYRLVGFLPSFMRPALFGLYSIMEKLRGLLGPGSIQYHISGK